MLVVLPPVPVLPPVLLAPPVPLLVPPVPPPVHLPHERWHEVPSQLCVHQPYSTACAQVSPLLGGKSVHEDALPPVPLLVPPVPLLVPPLAVVLPPVPLPVPPLLVAVPPVVAEVPPVVVLETPPVDESPPFPGRPPVLPTTGLPPVLPAGVPPVPVTTGGPPPEPVGPSLFSLAPLTQDARNTRVVALIRAAPPQRAKRKLDMHLSGITQSAPRRARRCRVFTPGSFPIKIF